MTLRSKSSMQSERKSTARTLAWRILGCFGLLAGFLGIGIASLVGLYVLVASPPLHWAFETAPPAGLNSVYVPGKHRVGVQCALLQR